MKSNEHELTNHAKNGPEVHNERSPQLVEQSGHSPERFDGNDAHQTVEMTRNEAIREARLEKEQGKERRAHQADLHNASRRITKDDRSISFDQTMDEVRKHLPRSTRGFSRFIHAPVIERASDALSRTVARPDSILAGGLTAFVVVLGLYFYAKYTGFALRGSETIIAFAVGWIIGVAFDFFKNIFTGKR